MATIIRFATLDEAVEEANRLPFGLSSYVFTQSLRTATLMGDAIEAGMFGINTTAISTPESPFGGVKHSGYGTENGIDCAACAYGRVAMIGIANNRTESQTCVEVDSDVESVFESQIE